MYGSDLCEAFLRSLKISQKSPRTLQTYRVILAQFGRWQFGRDRNLAATTLDDLEEYCCHLQDRHLAPRTMRLYTAALRTFFRWATDRDHVPANPCARLVPINVRPTAPKIPAWQEFERITSFPLESEEDYRDLAIMGILFSAGLRIAEFCSLKASTIDLETGEFLVVGKGNKEGECLISGNALQAVRVWWEMHKRRVGEISPDRSLFLSRYETPLGQNAVRRMIARRAKQMGVVGFTEYASGRRKTTFRAHAFRHLSATSMHDAGASLATIKEHLRHSSITATAIYIHVDRQQIRAAHARRLDLRSCGIDSEDYPRNTAA